MSPASAAPSEPPSHWWSEQRVEPGSGVRVRLGGFKLSVYRLAGEWQIGYTRTGELVDDADPWSIEPLAEAPEDVENLERYVASAAGDILRLRPAVADRSVVVRPRVPLHVLPGEESRIFVSSPVWVDVRVGREQISLVEQPVKRLSDTWFGPSTRVGEVAYALKSQARLHLDEMPQRVFRAITPIVVRNAGSDQLLIDRMNLPVPYLSIYTSSEGFLWTERVNLSRQEGHEMATLDVQKGAPREAEGSKQLSEPRRVAASNLIVRAFSSLLDPLIGGDRG